MPRVLPFRPFFVLAALDSCVAVGVWLWPAAGEGGAGLVAGSVAAWHARELLFGAFPAVLSGFLLTALPRWTGHGFAPPDLHVRLALLWLAGPASLLVLPDARGAVAAAYLVVLAVVVGRPILRAPDRRNHKILLLLVLLAGAAVIDLLAPQARDLAFRLAVAALLGLVMVLGGRIIPSLTEVHLERAGQAGLPPSSPSIELVAAGAAAAALAAWASAPAGPATAGIAAAAAVGQAARWLRWRPWRTVARPSLLALQGGYAAIPLGFAVVALHGLDPAAIPATAAAHVWAVGGIGLTSIAVMASMIRKHCGRPLAPSPVLNAAFALLGLAVAARTGAGFAVAGQGLLLATAAIAWVAAHLLFLAAFARDLLPGRAVGTKRA